ncbi:MAG: tRNA (N6-threonylcarbamoyladenosine(37)-N6)-methyltransferase TrmO [Methanomassiliicoccales archaeon]|nr:tRNA (N6-threonylcarbamoyladenosine(37)-N6)-methyltransferase TrmO [Methanomassiliicoccales archaeon]
MRIVPIGYVRSTATAGMDCRELESVVEVLPEFEEGLYTIERERELVILYVFDRSEGRALKVHPRGDPSTPLRGVFATRSPDRPNRIGMTTVELIRREGRLLHVKGLDAMDGSPVIDIKPLIRPDQRPISQK